MMKVRANKTFHSNESNSSSNSNSFSNSALNTKFSPLQKRQIAKEPSLFSPKRRESNWEK